MEAQLSGSQRLVVFNFDDLLKIVQEVVEEVVAKREAKIKEASSVPEWGTVDAACRMLHVSKPTFYSMVGKGAIETRKVGARRTLVNLHRLREGIETGAIGRYKHTNGR